MKLNRVSLHESFEDDTVQEHVINNPTAELILTLLDELDGQSLFVLQIFSTEGNYPHLYIIGGPDAFGFSLAKNLYAWKEYHNSIAKESNWRAFGLGYHNHEVYENELCDKQNTIRAIKHFCETGEWLIDIPFKENTDA